MKINNLHSYTNKHEDILKQVQEILKDNKQYYKGIRIRCAAFRNNDKFYNALCVVKAFSKDSEVDEQGNIYYDDLHLIEQWINLDELPDFLEQLKSGEFKLANEKILIGQISGSEFEFSHRSNDYCSLSGYRYKINYDKPNISIPSQLLLSHELPFYFDFYTAISEWSDIKRFTFDSYGYSIWVFFPECRAYFDKLEYIPKKGILSVKVKTNDTVLKLHIKGGYTCKKRYQGIGQALASGDTFHFKIPAEIVDDIENFEMYLIDDKDNLFDFHKETGYWFLGLHRAFEMPVETELEKQIMKVIDNGENEETEFKPFIKKGDNKIKEIIETVIAFANTRGGQIFIGIDKYAIPQGIDREIHEEIKKTPNKNIKESIKEYVGYLKKEISDNLSKTVSYKINNGSFRGKQILIITVQEGKLKPYYHFQTKEIFIRKGANNVKPDPDKDLPKIMPKNSGLPGTSFTGLGDYNSF